MKLKELQITNFGVVKGTRKYVFKDRGVIGIVGKNGKGKSHIIQAVKYALFNDADRILCYCVHDFGRDPEIQKAEVELTAEVDGQEFTIKRTISLKDSVDPEDREASIAKGEKFANVSSRASIVVGDYRSGKAADVQEKIYDLVGLRDSAAQDTVFVSQGRTGEILSKTRADKVDALQKLSGAGICSIGASKAKAMSGQINVVDRAEDLDVLNAKLHKLADDVASLDESDIETVDAQLAEAKEALRTANAAAAANREYLSKQQELAAINARIAELGTPTQTQDVDRTAYEALRDTLLEFARRKAAADTKTRYEGFMRDCANKMQQVSDAVDALVTPPCQEEQLKALHDEYTKHSTEANSYRQQAGVFLETGRCPTCGSEPEGGEEAIKALEAKMTESEAAAEAAHRQYVSSRAALEAFDAEKNKLLAEYKSAAETRNQHEAMVDALYETEYSEEEYAATQAKFDAMSAQIEAYNAYVAQEAAYNSTLAALQQQKQGIEASMPAQAEAPDPEQIQEMTEAVAVLRVRKDEALKAAGKLEALMQQLVELKAEKERLEAAQKDIEVQLSVKSYLESVSALLHRDELPKSISRFYYDRLNVLLAKYSAELSLTFVLRLDTDTYEFMADFEDGAKPFFLLSGGQQTIASWVWHLATHEKHAERMGLLMLDEPTYGLDTENLGKVQDVLSNVDKFCERAGLQTVMVSHEADLVSALTQIHEVS